AGGDRDHRAGDGHARGRAQGRPGRAPPPQPDRRPISARNPDGPQLRLRRLLTRAGPCPADGGYDDLRNGQRARREREERLQLGIGISSYVEMTAVLYTGESATATAQADGSMVISTGTTASGQGHETAYSQLASQLLGVSMDSIRVVQSDTALVKSGYGSSGSRSLQIGGSAVRRACIELVEKARQEAARRLEAAPDDIVRFDDGRFGVKGVPATALTWSELASEAALVAESEFEQADQTFPFGCHVAVVEVDMETGDARLVRHVAVDDCGKVLNPLLVEGQIHGGVAQGIG